jgi:hypothetical protein
MPPNACQAKRTVSVRRVYVALGRVGARWGVFTPKTRPNCGHLTGEVPPKWLGILTYKCRVPANQGPAEARLAEQF